MRSMLAAHEQLIEAEDQMEQELIQRVLAFVEYYDKNGSHRLGTGEALNFYVDAKDILRRLRLNAKQRS